MRSRAVFLSAGGDPFIASLVMRLWETKWYDEVDKFYVCYNNHAGVPRTVAQEFVKRVVADPKVHLIYHPTGIGNGMPITEMTYIAKEDYVMLLEDDGFIFKPGYVDGAFQMIEGGAYDAAGSPRGSCGKEVWDSLQQKYHLDYSGIGDIGPNYWPNFFFCKRQDLLNTDMNMASKEFTRDDYYKEMDHRFKETNYGDTFVWADIQMRYNGVRFAHIPQYHASPEEIEYYEGHTDKWREGTRIGWIHGGSLSAGLNGFLDGAIPDMPTLSTRMEIETRCAFWRLAVDYTEGYDGFRQVYKQNIQNLIDTAKLSSDRVHRKYNIYKNLLEL